MVHPPPAHPARRRWAHNIRRKSRAAESLAFVVRADQAASFEEVRHTPRQEHPVVQLAAGHHGPADDGRADEDEGRAEDCQRPAAKSFWSAAVASIVLGVLSVVPYNCILKGDPGSPLFISFVLHIVIVLLSLPRAVAIFKGRKFPIKYHAAFVVLGCLFTSLKSDAFCRLPASVALLLNNLRMVVGVLAQYVMFRKIYSRPQLVGVAVVTVGVALAGNSMQQASTTASDPEGGPALGADFLIGVLEIFGSSLALALLGTTVKAANATFGESVEEQVFFQHLFALPLVFPSQWDKIGPRMEAWASQPDPWLLFSLAASVVATFAERRAAAAMAGRSPSLLMTQLVQTLEGFLQILVVAFMGVGLPPAGFWLGTVALVAGSCLLGPSGA